MTSPLDHIFIPVAILLLFSKKLKLNQREIIALGFITVLPDMDGIFFGSNSTHLHRVLFHNIFIVIIPFLLFILAKSKHEVFGIICFYLTSHLILDLFTGGIFLFYPVYNKVFFAHMELLLSHSSFMPVIEYGISNKIMNNGIGEPVISSENVAFAILLIICAAISAIPIHRKTE